MEMYGSTLKTEIHQVSTCKCQSSKERENHEILSHEKSEAVHQLTTWDANLGVHYY